MRYIGITEWEGGWRLGLGLGIYRDNRMGGRMEVRVRVRDIYRDNRMGGRMEENS